MYRKLYINNIENPYYQLTLKNLYKHKVNCYFKKLKIMSQFTTIFNISKEFFEELKKNENRKEIKLYNRAKSSYTFQNSFMAIEYVLKKNKSDETKEVLNKIFNPKEFLGDFDFENADFEEMMDFMESGNYFPYLNIEEVSEINKILSKISELEIKEKYNATELNENDIYPNEWTNVNNEGESNNLNHLIGDFLELKKIIMQSNKEKNYLLICSG